MKQLFGKFVSCPVKDHQIDLHFLLQQKFAEGGNGDLQGFVLGEAIVIGGNQRECDGPAAMLQRQLQGIIIAFA